MLREEDLRLDKGARITHDQVITSTIQKLMPFPSFISAVMRESAFDSVAEAEGTVG